MKINSGRAARESESLIIGRDGTPFASAEVPIYFANGAARESFIKERGQDLDLDGHSVIVREFWSAGYERSHHGEPGVVELGEI
jgi:hypothetical protein